LLLILVEASSPRGHHVPPLKTVSGLLMKRRLFVQMLHDFRAGRYLKAN
jgi:hypothetical protein